MSEPGTVGWEEARADRAEARNAELEAKVGELEVALQSIAANTCCDKCQEAALIARQALSGSPAPVRDRVMTEQPEPGSVWKHRNGNTYKVLFMVNVEPGKEDKFPTSVVYTNVETGACYSRRITDWPGGMVLREAGGE